MSATDAMESALADSGLDEMADPNDILDDFKAAGYAVVELPKPNSTRYEGEDHEPVDRLGWWQEGSLFGVSQWGYPNQVQLAFDGEPFEPLSAEEARFIAAALLAAVEAAEV